MAATPLGRFAWYEILTDDPKATARFYGRVVGWTTEEFSGGGKPYTMLVNDGRPMGGMLPLEDVEMPGVQPQWLAYVSTPDLDDTVARAVALGGSKAWDVVDVPTVGRLGGILDPFGASVALLQPEGEPPGTVAPAEVGEFSWHELLVADWKSAFDFYTDLFGWEDAGSEKLGAEMGTYQMFSNGAHPVGAMFTPPHTDGAQWLFYVRVGDLDGAVARVTENGGTVLNGPMEVPGGDRVAQCADPHGAAFALHQTKA